MNPPRLFSWRLLSWLALYFVLWTVLPLWLSGSYPLDVVEGIYWGHEWQWGYYKHPPLSSWLLYGFYAVFGHIGPYLLSQLAIVLSLWLVYRLGRQLMSRQRALLGSLLLLAVFYYTWPSLEFNHNIAQLPVWAGIIYAFYLAITTQRLRYWLLFGLLAGAGMLVKYTVAILLLVAVLYSLLTPQRRLWRTRGPWLALLLALLVFLPNVLWLWQHEWLPFTYAQARAAEAESSGGRLSALGFLATQLLNHLPLLLILLATRTGLQRLPENTDTAALARPNPQAQRFLWVMGLGPALLLVLLGLLLGIGLRDMWGMPMWSLSGLLVASLIPAARFERQYPRLLKGLAVWLLLATVLMGSYVQWGGQWRNKPSRMDWPQAALAQQADSTWQALSRCGLDNIAGDYWLAGLAATDPAAFSSDRPSVMIGGNPAYSPWMSAARLQSHGSLMVWPQGEPPPVPLLDNLPPKSGLVVREGEWQIAWQKLPKRAPLTVQWRAYIPQSCFKPQP